jgi:hypothetical protein
MIFSANYGEILVCTPCGVVADVEVECQRRISDSQLQQLVQSIRLRPA